MKTAILSILLSLMTVLGCSSDDSFPGGKFLAGTYLGMDQDESFALVRREAGEVRVCWLQRVDESQAFFSDAVVLVKGDYSQKEQVEWVQLEGSKIHWGKRREFWAHKNGELWDGRTDMAADYLNKEISLTPWMRPVDRDVWQQEFDAFLSDLANSGKSLRMSPQACSAFFKSKCATSLAAYGFIPDVDLKNFFNPRNQ